MSNRENGSGIIKTIFISTILVFLVFAGYVGVQEQLKRFPDLQDPKIITYDWNYKGRAYSLSLSLHGSVYEYYNDEPKGLIVDEEEATLEKYLLLPDEDSSIRELTKQLSDLAVKSGLDEGEKLELAAAFVQNIPYDQEKANTDRENPRYGYEVLYDNLGICSGKSFLMYNILEEMGYGSSILLYPNEEHMNVGVETDLQYSMDNSGYTSIETTNPKLKIGVIPSIDTSSRQAREKKAILEFNLRNPTTTSGKSLSSPLIFAKTNGKKYYGIIETFRKESEIADIQNFLSQKEPLIVNDKNELDSMAEQMNNLKATNRLVAFNRQVPVYNKMVANLNEIVNEFNSKVNRYNDLIAENFF